MDDVGELAGLEHQPLEARLTTQFYAWERWGRGWNVWPWPVALEPPFRPFLFHSAPTPGAPVDDGRRPTLLSSLFDSFAGQGPASQAEEFSSWLEELSLVPDPDPVVREEPPAEIQIVLPATAKVRLETVEQFMLAASVTPTGIAFEVIGLPDAIVLQLAFDADQGPYIRDQIQAHFAEAIVTDASGFLAEKWKAAEGTAGLVVDFGLSEEFMCPLATADHLDPDPLGAIVGALAGVRPGEIGVLQILFAAACAPWADSIMRSVTNGSGGSFFGDAPDMVRLASEKVSRPLFGAVLRVGARSKEHEGALRIAQRLAAALRQFTRPGSNALIPLENEDYPDEEHEADLLERESRRSGMLLNVSELASFAHLPSPAVTHPKLRREARRTKAAPMQAPPDGLILGENLHEGVTRRVAVSIPERLRHIHVVGGTGTGKSTLLLSLIAQDIESGHGFAILDPHGDLVDEVLTQIPESRFGDVVLVNPADERPVGFNILQAHSELERNLLASDLVAIFRRLSTSWGDQMHSVLANAILAFLESDRGGTIGDLRRFLVEPEFRKEILETVRDAEVRYYWTKEFTLLAGKPQGPILTRLDTFLRPRLVRAMVNVRKDRLDLASVMNQGKILLVKLAQGMIGEENAALLGSILVAKLHQLVMGRQEQKAADRRPFFLYIDEFQHFVTPSMATLLTGARKFGLGLVLAHQ